jgi:hypothetical protein
MGCTRSSQLREEDDRKAQMRWTCSIGIPVTSEANRRGYIWNVKATSPIMTAQSALHKRAVPSRTRLRFPRNVLQFNQRSPVKPNRVEKRNGEEAEASSPFSENRAIYWSAERASQATSVAGAAPPVGSTWITPDSSLQNVRLPVAFTLRGTAPVT